MNFIPFFIKFYCFNSENLLIYLGCGNTVIEARNAIKSCVNIQGQQLLDKFNEELLDQRDLIEIGDIQGLSNISKNGVAKNKILATTTSDPCLQQVIPLLAEVDSFTAFILQCTRDPNEAAEIVCNTLNYKAQRLNSCRASTSNVYVVLA